MTVYSVWKCICGCYEPKVAGVCLVEFLTFQYSKREDRDIKVYTL